MFWEPLSNFYKDEVYPNFTTYIIFVKSHSFNFSLSGDEKDKREDRNACHVCRMG